MGIVEICSWAKTWTWLFDAQAAVKYNFTITFNFFPLGSETFVVTHKSLLTWWPSVAITHIFTLFPTPTPISGKSQWENRGQTQKDPDPKTFLLLNSNPQSALFHCFNKGKFSFFLHWVRIEGGLRRLPRRVPFTQDPQNPLVWGL